jgi:hypothetical protein
MTTDAALPDWVTAGLEAVEADQEARQVIPGRFPFTYAYDFLRSHPAAFSAPEGMSRADVAGWPGGRLSAEQQLDVCIALAYAYIWAEGLVITAEASARFVAVTNGGEAGR